MIKFPRGKKEISTETVINTVWVSTFLAMILALPPLAIFLGIYYSMDNLVVGAVLGFGVHFMTLAFSGRISKALIRLVS